MADPDDLATIESLVKELDQKPSEERSHINVYYLENADAETLAKTLNEILTGLKAQQKPTPARPGQPSAGLSEGKVTITADKPTNSLIVNATPEDYDTIKGIVRQLDIKRKQVFVEALILELSMDATEQLGASLQGAVATGGNSARLRHQQPEFRSSLAQRSGSRLGQYAEPAGQDDQRHPAGRPLQSDHRQRPGRQACHGTGTVGPDRSV